MTITFSPGSDYCMHADADGAFIVGHQWATIETGMDRPYVGWTEEPPFSGIRENVYDRPTRYRIERCAVCRRERRVEDD